jgi:acyl-CoA synthetase (AMP-forming)/AMP-acid ligase II
MNDGNDTAKPQIRADTLRELIRRRADENPAGAYLEDARSNRQVSYAVLEKTAASWSARFTSLGLAPSAAVLIDVSDPLGFAVAHLATIASGLRSIPVDTGQPRTELARLSGLIGGAALVITDQPDNALPIVTTVCVDRESLMPSTTRAVPNSTTNSPQDPPGTGSVVLFTSGSTGTPKGVELPEQQLLSVARGIAKHNRLTHEDRGFNSLPLFHVNAEVVGLLSTLVAGATLVLDGRFHRTGFWDLLAERRITWLNAVPAMLAVLVRTGPISPPATLRFIRSASAPLPGPVRAALGEVPLIVSWGMTEGASQITATPLGTPGRPGSVGIPIGGEVQVRDENHRVLTSAGKDGVLWIHGAGIVDRYLFGRGIERFDSNGWLNTGDLGHLDADGYVYLVGRSDDVINRGGEKVYPSEIEDVLLGDPRVIEAVVVGRPDPVLGHVPIAYVIPTQETVGADLERLASELHDLCERNLTRFRRPVDISVVTDLPHAATGKVQRNRVRDLASTQAGTR